MAKARSAGETPSSTPGPSSRESQDCDGGTIAVSTDLMDSGPSPDASGSESGRSTEEPQEEEEPSDADNAEQVYVKMEDVKGGGDVAPKQGSHMPVLKRRRVTRACDECRRKKIKCDGKQPCTHCKVYSYECTYDKPSNRRRNPAPQYIEALENKLQRAEALLRKFMPDVDLNDPNLDPAVQQEFQNRERARLQAAKPNKKEAQEQEAADRKDTQIMSMIETIGQLDLTETGGWDFRGTSSGAVFLRRMKQHFRGLLGYDYKTTFLPRPARIAGLLYLDSPRSSSSASPSDANLPNVYDLPPREKSWNLSYCALTCATCLLRIVHLPSFYEKFERLYDKPVESFDAEDNRFLGLLYAVIAVGCMYNTAEENVAKKATYSEATEEGTKYYTAARVLLQDIAECRDLTSLQALLFLILFLQATSNLSACYAFLGIALRSALRMGLHRHLPHAGFSPVVQEERRRVFFFIRQLDIYVSALLGFPILLNSEDIDQQLPTELDDEYITQDGFRTPPPGTPGSVFQAVNAHSRLMDILQKIIKYIYPMKGIEQCATNEDENPHATYTISYARIKEIEGDLQEWLEQLPSRWRPNSEGPIEVFRIRTLLRFAYAHVQMMLYRPFLHYISPRLSSGKVVDDRYYACAAAGISVARNIVHLAREIKDQALVVGPFWSMLYSEFFAILTLVFYTLENPGKQGSAEMFADANAGREMIANMAQRSMAADRINNTLSSLWGNLPESVKSRTSQDAPTKKRSAPGPKQGSVPLPTQKALQRRSDDLSRPQTGQKGAVVHRASFDVPHRSTQGYVANYPELHTLDMSSTGAHSDTSGTPSSSHPGPFLRHGSQSQNQTDSSSNLYKLDAMMFPSGDPFAYPNQPLLNYNLGAQQVCQSAAPLGASHAQDSRNYYMSPLYGDIEGQLMGPVPPYLMQPAQGQGGVDLSGQIYHPPSSLALQQDQSHQTAHHRDDRELDDMMADAGGFKGNWGDMFGNRFRPL